MEQLLTANVATNLYWFGRYLERIEATLLEVVYAFDKIIDTNKDCGKEIYEKLGIDLDYSCSKDFLNKAIFGNHHANLHTLISHAKENAIIKQYEILFELDGVELEFTDEALEKIAEIAVEKDVGARGLRGIIENIMLPLQYIIPSENNLEKCRITKEYIDKESDVELKYNENSTEEPTKEIVFKKMAN